MIPIAIFFISAAALGLELVLVRAFSIGHWYHFSYLVISTAMLGFAAGGTFVTIFSKSLSKYPIKSLWIFAFAMALTVPLVFWISQSVPLDELQLIWDSRQILYLFAYYLLFFIPFFCAGTFVALAFTARTGKAHSLYFYNMAGSGLGVAAIVTLMYGNSPSGLLLIISSIAFLAALVMSLGLSRSMIAVTFICALVAISLFGFLIPGSIKVKISQNKSLAYYRALPDAETLAVRYSPLGRLDCVQASSIRYFPSLSIAYQGSLPPQMLIVSDADGISAINHFEDTNDLNCYDHTTSAIGYHLLNAPDVCIIGAGGGSDIAQALTLNARSITAVEMNSQIVDLVRDKFDKFASGIYNRDDVNIVVAEGRNFLQTTDKHFDIINISLLDSFTASAAGLYALNESHLYTIEAVRQALSKLRPKGLLSITRILKTPPPRDSLKMFATVVEALRRLGIHEPANHIIMIRSWATATIVASPQPFSKAQIENARRFTNQRCFDLVHLPGIEPGDINIFHILEQPIYYQYTQRILSDKRDDFYRDYVYNIQPATDDRPYFFDFFKWKSLPLMIRTLPRQWLPFSEWAYLVLVATLLQAVVASSVFILLPLLIAKPVKAVRTGKLAALAFFLLLGLSYMFLEMGFIQKLTLLIGHPVFGVAVTLVGFLFFSGCGSLTSGRLLKQPQMKGAVNLIRLAVLAIIIIGLAEIFIVTFAFESLVSFSRPARILLGLAITAPLAFFMGMPFPTALRQLDINRRPLIPWAWGINGFASVTGAVLGTFLAISVGFSILMTTALALYLLSAVIFKRICT